jgi:hypothetical protein
MDDVEARMNENKIQQRIKTLKDSATALEQRIVDPKTKEYFLRPVWNGLSDVERFLLPSAAKSAHHSQMWMDAAEFQLEQSQALLRHAQEMVAKYGTSLQLVG